MHPVEPDCVYEELKKNKIKIITMSCIKWNEVKVQVFTNSTYLRVPQLSRNLQKRFPIKAKVWSCALYWSWVCCLSSWVLRVQERGISEWISFHVMIFKGKLSFRKVNFVVIRWLEQVQWNLNQWHSTNKREIFFSDRFKFHILFVGIITNERFQQESFFS